MGRLDADVGGRALGALRRRGGVVEAIDETVGLGSMGERGRRMRRAAYVRTKISSCASCTLARGLPMTVFLTFLRLARLTAGRMVMVGA